MTRFFQKYKYHLVFFICCCFVATATQAQLVPRYDEPEKGIEVLPPQLKIKPQKNTFYLPKEMEDLITYARTASNPMQRDSTPELFLERYFPYHETRLMRNGDLAYLKFYYEKYLRTLEETEHLAIAQALTYEGKRRLFFKQSTLANRKEKRQYWRKFKQKKEELLVNYNEFKKYLIPALSTELSMILQERHFPELAYSMNQLQNLDGTPLSVNIYSNQELYIANRNKSTIAGLSIISKCDDVFTSGSPAVRDAYPGLRGSNKGLTVHLRMFEDGVTLSHELGHLYYLYYKWDEYVDYIQRKGKDYEPGGHGPDDPSGLAARMTEEGKLPFTVESNQRALSSSSQ